MLQVLEPVVPVKDERKDYTDKADPIREHDCIWCMACVSVCPPQAVKVDQSSLEFHEKESGTFNEVSRKEVHHHRMHTDCNFFYLFLTSTRE